MPNCHDCKKPIAEPAAVSCFDCAQSLREDVAAYRSLLKEFGQCSECYRTFREDDPGCDKCRDARHKLR